MKFLLKLLILVALLENIASCEFLSNVNSSKHKALTPVDYLEKSAKLDIKNFFNGELEVFAVVQDAGGKIESSYTSKVVGKWEEGRGNVQFNYLFNNGKKDSRTWLFTINDSSGFSIIGHDFIESGNGRNQGNAAVINYSLNLNRGLGDKKQRVDFEDYLYLVDEKSAIIISSMKQDKKNVAKAIISLKKVN